MGRRRLVNERSRCMKNETITGFKRVPFHEEQILAQELAPDILALDTALARLEQTNPRPAQVVKLRYFGGMSVDEAARVLGVHRATAHRHWAYGRAWIRAEIRSSDQSEV